MFSCMKQTSIILFLLFTGNFVFAQPTPFFLKGALKENRQQFHRNLVNNSIIKNLSFPLSDSTESYWISAFEAMELIGYSSPWANSKIYETASIIQQRSVSFQQAFLELSFTHFQRSFLKEIESLMQQTTNSKIFSMCIVYLKNDQDYLKRKDKIAQTVAARKALHPADPILSQLDFLINSTQKPPSKKAISSLLEPNYLPGNTLLISFQRTNRDFPGAVIVRDKTGHFIFEGGKLFSVPQLARSISNLPCFISNGNTPEGIFRMDGFDTSGSAFIGPTTNIQLTMPFEYKASHFFSDSSLPDSAWTLKNYINLLPDSLKLQQSLYQSYYAGQSGRTEIIAHGTTMTPSYYKSKPYYPLTPTQGCLCCREIWNEETGRLMVSDQQKLVDVVNKAGGANGYLIVINIDEKQQPVDEKEIVEFLQLANGN